MSLNKDGTYTGYIYKIENLINGKCYIGQITTTIEHRWGQHKSDNTSPNPMYKAFKKYGIENFSIKEVAHYTRDTKEELLEILNAKEIYYINKYNSLITQDGYNLSIGGENSGIYNCHPIDVYDRDGNLLYQYESAKEASRLIGYDTSCIIDCCNGTSIPTIDYIFRYKNEPYDKYNTKRTYCRELYQFTLDGKLVKKHDSIVKAVLSVDGSVGGLNLHLRGIRKTYKGYYWNYENKFNYIPSKDVRKKIDKYTLDGKYIATYNSAKEAQESVNATNSHSIVGVCNGKLTKAYNYIWRYAGDPYDKFQNFIDLKNNNFSYGKPVDMYSKDKKFIKTFNSMIDAAKEIDSTNTNICCCCLGKTKSVKGYIFRYHGDSIDKFSCSYKTQKQPILAYDLSGNLLNTYPSKNKASKEIGINYHKIEDYCDGRNNHIYEDKVILYEKDKGLIDDITKQTA